MLPKRGPGVAAPVFCFRSPSARQVTTWLAFYEERCSRYDVAAVTLEASYRERPALPLPLAGLEEGGRLCWQIPACHQTVPPSQPQLVQAGQRLDRGIP